MMLLSTISSTTSRDPSAKGSTKAPTAGPALPLRWTADHVGQRLVEAMRTLDRLPRPKGPRVAGNHWPCHRVEWVDRLAQAELPEEERRARASRHLAGAFRPSGAEIGRMDRVLDWLRDMRADDPDACLLLTLWALRTARRRPLRALCLELGCTPPTFYKLRARAVERLADRLEARGVGVF